MIITRYTVLRVYRHPTKLGINYGSRKCEHRPSGLALNN